MNGWGLTTFIIALVALVLAAVALFWEFPRRRP